jgi:hypothetical protein
VAGSRHITTFGVAASLEIRLEDRFAGRAPARLPLQQPETVTAALRFSSQHPP